MNGTEILSEVATWGLRAYLLAGLILVLVWGYKIYKAN